MHALLLVAAGGAAGAVCRLLISLWLGTHHLFPWATLGINIAGSFAIGLLWGAWGHTEWFLQWGRLLLVVGVLGGFTTFSAFSMETLNLLQSDRVWSGVAYATASLFACLLAVFAGERLGGSL
ncbi:MAG: fluoride efflux transporter CrcB [Pseudomonadota bacterium]